MTFENRLPCGVQVHILAPHREGLECKALQGVVVMHCRLPRARWAELFLQQIVYLLRIGFALSRFHDLTNEKPEQFVFT